MTRLTGCAAAVIITALAPPALAQSPPDAQPAFYQYQSVEALENQMKANRVSPRTDLLDHLLDHWWANPHLVALIAGVVLAIICGISGAIRDAWRRHSWP
jgi:hypothetical protein